MNQPLAMEMDENTWASAWAQGDMRAYDGIVRRYAPLIHARCQRALGSSDADDATQAVFLVLARKGDQAAASPVLAAWLYRVAELVIANAMRDRRRRQHAERNLPPPTMTAEAEPAEETMASIRPQLDACLADLPARERETVLLHHLAGHSLAEVATLTGSPVSTVKYRLSRGLERLRALLAKRGVTVSALALLACLQAEARAEVPAELLRCLHDLAPARTGSAATAVPVQSLSWSHTERRFMTHIALAGAALLLVGTAFTYHVASQPAAAESAEPPISTAANTPEAIDPAKARLLMFARCSDVPATIDRLLRQPEATLLPSESMSQVDLLRGVRRAELACDVLSDLDPGQRATQVQEWLRTAQGAAQETRPDEAMRRHVDKLAVGGLLEVMSGRTGTAVLDIFRSQPPSFAAGGQFAFQPAGLTFAQVSSQGVPAPDCAALFSAFPADGDLEAGIVLDPGIANRPLEQILLLRARVEPDGLQVGIVSPGTVGSTAEAQVSPKQLEALPGSALAGCVLGINRGWLSGVAVAGPEDGDGPNGSINLEMGVGGRWHGSLRLRDPILRHTADTACTALNQADGEVRAWIQPAVPFPVLWVVLPLPREAAVALTSALGGKDPAAGFSYQMDMLLIQGRWRDGHLIVTTDPAGPGAQPAMQGFGDHPEVQAALKTMPSRPASMRLVMRPAACLDQLLPYLRMALPPDHAKSLTSYRASMATAQTWLVKTRMGDKACIEAKGLLSLLAIAWMANQFSDPAALIRGIN